jgi:carbon-monoxide dehydrogenase medium subunit
LNPLLVAAIAQVAHYQIRNRGTVGGSLAHADPAAELPCLAVTCDATLKLDSVRGARLVTALDFFLGPMSTDLVPDELIEEIAFPIWPRGRHWAFEEFARRRGDFALAGVALFFDADDGSRTGNAHIGVIGGSDRPIRLHQVEQRLNGRRLDAALINEAVTLSATVVAPPEDIHASAAYRRALVGTLLERALQAALRQKHE